MRRLALLLLVVSPGLLPAAPKELPRPRPLAITHVTLIDGNGGPPLPDRTVLVRDSRIAAVGKSGNVTVPEGAEVVDGTGKFLIPGLWDMHVHTVGADFLTLFVANGVTGVRDMHAFFPSGILFWRKQVAEGKLLGPRIVAAGPIVDGPKPFWPGSKEVANAEQGREVVRALKKQGVDFIKVYTKLPRDAYFAVAAEARKQGLVFAGHVPELVTAAEASDAGQKSIEHLYGVWVACSTKEADLRKELQAAVAKSDNPALAVALCRINARALDGYDEKRAKALFARFVKNGTWQCPTLTVLRGMSSLDDKKFTADPRVKYVPNYLKSFWTPPEKVRGSKEFKEAVAAQRPVYKKSFEVVRAMHRAGVPLLAGTDTSNPYCFPGFSLHDELALLVEAGLKPMEALQCATRNPAKYLGKLDTLGTVEKGKAADLVLLDADPLADIKNTRKIAAVVVNGRLLTRAALDKLLAEVEANAGGKN